MYYVTTVHTELITVTLSTKKKFYTMHEINRNATKWNGKKIFISMNTEINQLSNDSFKIIMGIKYTNTSFSDLTEI